VQHVVVPGTFGPVRIHDAVTGEPLVTMEGMCQHRDGDPDPDCVPAPELPVDEWVWALAGRDQRHRADRLRHRRLVGRDPRPRGRSGRCDDRLGERRQLDPDRGSVRNIAFLGDHHLLATGAEGPLLVVTLDLDELLDIARDRLTRGFNPKRASPTSSIPVRGSRR
jgi:hypothetical protein